MYKYFFEIKDGFGRLIGSGNFLSSYEMSEAQKINFAHQYTNNAFKNSIITFKN